jgi:hypothetical protein
MRIVDAEPRNEVQERRGVRRQVLEATSSTPSR